MLPHLAIHLPPLHGALAVTAPWRDRLEPARPRGQVRRQAPAEDGYCAVRNLVQILSYFLRSAPRSTKIWSRAKVLSGTLMFGLSLM